LVSSLDLFLTFVDLADIGGLGIITSSAIDGQKTYHHELDKEMRAYIKRHATEFHAVVEEPATGLEHRPETEAERVAREANERPSVRVEAPSAPLRKALEPIEPLLRHVTTALAGFVDVVGGFDVSPSKLAIGILLGALLLSNVWSLLSHKSASSTPRTPYGAGGDWQTSGSDVGAVAVSAGHATEHVAAAVKDVLHEYFAASHRHDLHGHQQHHIGASEWVGGSVEEMAKLLDGLEARIAKLRSSLSDTD
jgi:hypothetical protein